MAAWPKVWKIRIENQRYSTCPVCGRKNDHRTGQCCEHLQKVTGSHNAIYKERSAALEAYDLVEQLIQESPELKTLKAHVRSLSAEERGQAGEAVIRKSVVNGKTWYWSATHRAYQVRSRLKDAVSAYWKIVEPSG